MVQIRLSSDVLPEDVTVEWGASGSLIVQLILRNSALRSCYWRKIGRRLEGQMQTCWTAVILVAGFFAALRGEEITRVDLGAIRLHWDEAINFDRAPHVPLMLSGRFKRETGEKLFCQPLATTSTKGLDVKNWFYRTICVMEKCGITTGPLFRVAGSRGKSWKRASMGDIEPLFHRILCRVQQRFKNVIPEEVNVESEFSIIYRSLRRGATAEAQNVGIPSSIIEANNRWRKHMRSRGMLPGMSMMERYTDAKASVPSLIIGFRECWDNPFFIYSRTIQHVRPLHGRLRPFEWEGCFGRTGRGIRECLHSLVLTTASREHNVNYCLD